MSNAISTNAGSARMRSADAPTRSKMRFVKRSMLAGGGSVTVAGKQPPSLLRSRHATLVGEGGRCGPAHNASLGGDGTCRAASALPSSSGSATTRISRQRRSLTPSVAPKGAIAVARAPRYPLTRCQRSQTVTVARCSTTTVPTIIQLVAAHRRNSRLAEPAIAIASTLSPPPSRIDQATGSNTER